jgi:hypothetical protein
VRVEPGYEEDLWWLDRQQNPAPQGYRDGTKDQYGSGLGLVLFRLVVPPLQSGVVGPYLAQSE